MLLRCGKHNFAFLGHELKKDDTNLSFPIRCCSLGVASKKDVEGTIERIKEMFKKVEISPSAYDTAWVAMVPSMRDSASLERPCFQECLDWVMENQHRDGSWGLHQDQAHPSLLVKDVISSTLACILALRKWRVGEQLVQRGLDYIKCNSWAINDKVDQVSPLDFDIVFPGMLDIAKNLELSVPLDPAIATIMLRNRDTEIKRLFENDELKRRMCKDVAGSCFVEGVITDPKYYWRWLDIVEGRRNSNGSFSNSPATTAAALIQQYDVRGFEYLRSTLDIFKNWVPTLYPMNIYISLRMVDTLQRLGVSRYFRDEIRDVLDETYRLWEQKHEEILSDVVCCAMAFRLLRMNAYQVSSDNLAEFGEEDYFSERRRKHISGIAMILELYKASQLSINTKADHVLERIHGWTSEFLKKQLLNTSSISDKQLYEEVDFALKNCHGIFDRLESRHSMEVYDVHKVRLLKTSYRCLNIDNRDFLACSQKDFNNCQVLHQKELQQLERWYKDCRLDQLKFSRHYLQTSYFLIAATLFEPEMFQARIAWTQVLILITVLDDLFDNRGSMEEILNIFELVKLWDEQSSAGYCSKDVEICFTALHKTLDELAAKASICQGRCVRHHLISLWQEMMLNGFMRDIEWSRDAIPEDLDEYLSVACISVGCRPLILTTMYFLGEKLPEYVIQSEECRNLCSHVAIVARLNNDLQTFKKERGESKVNSVSIQVQSGLTEDEAITNIKEMTESGRKQLLQMVLQSQPPSLLPKVCKDLFWITSTTSYYLYSSIDEYNSPNKMLNHINAVIYDPIQKL